MIKTFEKFQKNRNQTVGGVAHTRHPLSIPFHCQMPEKKVQVVKDQEKAQSEKTFPLQKPRWKKNKLTIRYLYHETYRKPNEQLFSQ